MIGKYNLNNLLRVTYGFKPLLVCGEIGAKFTKSDY